MDELSTIGKIEKEIQKKQTKRIVIEEGGLIKWDGFDNLYEVLGFIDIHMNPNDLKRSILESNQKK